MTKIVFISDVHQLHNDLVIPECDILVSAGDYSFEGTIHEITSFHTWLDKQPAKHLISVQGNHEVGVEKNFAYSKSLATTCCPRVHFVDNDLVEIENLKIYCSAITPWFCDWAWNKQRGAEIRRYWDLIPDDTDILATHGPPVHILDETHSGEHVGCQDLYNRVMDIKPKIHAYGHIHPAYGTEFSGNTFFINASVCNGNYDLINKPIVVEIDENKKVTYISEP